MRPVVLSVAGSDPSGGAGIQADLKTFHAHGVFGQAVVSLLTVQNTMGVREVVPIGADVVGRQLVALLQDTPPDALKTGALADGATVHALADALEAHAVRAPLVVDPVLVSSSGRALAADDVVEAVRDRLLPRCALVTPNLAEASLLVGYPVHDLRGAQRAAHDLCAMGAAAALVTGGHLPGAPVDVLVADGCEQQLSGERIVTRHTHGTGCTYSAAVTCRLARGQALPVAVAKAKQFLTAALAGAPGLGRGQGPLDFFAAGVD